MRRLVPLIYLVKVRAQRRQVYVDHYRLAAQHSYRSVAEYTMHVTMDLLKSGSVLSHPFAKESTGRKVGI